MKLSLIVVFTSIFVLQLHHSECGFRLSFLPHKRISHIDIFKHVPKPARDEHFSSTSREKGHKNLFDVFKNTATSTVNMILKTPEAHKLSNEDPNINMTISQPVTMPGHLEGPNSTWEASQIPISNTSIESIYNLIRTSAKSTANKIFKTAKGLNDKLGIDSISNLGIDANIDLTILQLIAIRSLEESNMTLAEQSVISNVSDLLRKATKSNVHKGFETISRLMEHKCLEEDPTVHMTTPQLIAMHGYPAESHTIITDDGYILTIHRIPYSKKSKNKLTPGKTVLLHHGLLGNSAQWVIPGPKKGLAYILSDAGYDVWLANVRGNSYSRAHVSRNINSFEFWNFLFHEVSQHDLPAVIDYIMEFKGEGVKINYIGHSMGTTILFALLSTKIQYNNVLRAGFALAPVAYMTHIKSPLKLLAKHSDNIELLLILFGGANEFLPQNPVIRHLAKLAGEVVISDEKGIIDNTLAVLFGHDVEQFNKTLLPLLLSQGISGASTKTIVHYAQEIKQSGKFQMFDYGPVDNFKKYGTIFPPEYPLNKITLPIALFSAENDWLASVSDVTKLHEQLVNPIEHYVVPMKEFNHLDFLLAIDAPTLLYGKLLRLLEDEKKQYSSDDILDNYL